MRNKFVATLFLFFLITCFVLLPACTKKNHTAELSTQQLSEEAQQAAATPGEEEAVPATAAGEPPEGLDMFVDEDVYFAKKSSSLSPEAQEILIKKAAWLLDNPRVKVLIKGYSNDPGTAEYNLALGDWRARNVKTFLIQQGIDQTRLIAISFGREHPASTVNDEESAAKNRRVHFEIDSTY
jgi:peptidoglycan-associated lipoprotein